MDKDECFVIGLTVSSILVVLIVLSILWLKQMLIVYCITLLWITLYLIVVSILKRVGI